MKRAKDVSAPEKAELEKLLGRFMEVLEGLPSGSVFSVVALAASRGLWPEGRDLQMELTFAVYDEIERRGWRAEILEPDAIMGMPWVFDYRLEK